MSIRRTSFTKYTQFIPHLYPHQCQLLPQSLPPSLLLLVLHLHPHLHQHLHLHPPLLLLMMMMMAMTTTVWTRM